MIRMEKSHFWWCRNPCTTGEVNFVTEMNNADSPFLACNFATPLLGFCDLRPMDQFSIQDSFSRADGGMLMRWTGHRSSRAQREKREMPGFWSLEIGRGCYFNSGLIRRDDGHRVRKGSQIRPPTLSLLFAIPTRFYMLMWSLDLWCVIRSNLFRDSQRLSQNYYNYDNNIWILVVKLALGSRKIVISLSYRRFSLDYGPSSVICFLQIHQHDGF